jgi:hypothetical protein
MSDATAEIEMLSTGELNYMECIVTGWIAGFETGQGQDIFLLSTASRPALGPTQPRIKWASKALPR